jgi:hypothetical protein
MDRLIASRWTRGVIAFEAIFGPGCEWLGAISAQFSAFDWKVGLFAREVLRSPKET